MSSMFICYFPLNPILIQFKRLGEEKIVMSLMFWKDDGMAENEILFDIWGDSFWFCQQFSVRDRQLFFLSILFKIVTLMELKEFQ